jgi:hypothetical protein
MGRQNRSATSGLVAALVLWAAASGQAATLPPHSALRILIVSDEVNPHGLSDAELTQPGDILAALLAPGSGIQLDPNSDAVVEIATNDLSMATALLSAPIDSASAYDVVIYFAHRSPSGPSGAQDQEDFVAAVEAFLVAGGGLVSFHHGSYLTGSKASMQELIGATASGSVPWNTVDGQNVINVAPSHFVTSNEVEYPSSVAYEDAGRGVPSDTYGFFNNTPDERYTTFEINPTAGAFSVLFASDYDQSGTTHLLGFEHRRPEWAGVVIGYQPGEYQPNALDDLDANNFQILANAIVYAAYVEPAAVPALSLPAQWLLMASLLLSAGIALRAPDWRLRSMRWDGRRNRSGAVDPRGALS